MQLTTLLAPEAVLAKLEARDKKHALKQLAAHASGPTGLSEREIYSVLMERETLGCTGMGNGVCIPHGRFAKLDSIRAFFATLVAPIEFGATDGKPVDMFFILLTPAEANTEHLKALATISRLMRDRELCDNLRKLPDAQSVYQAIIRSGEEM